MKLNIVPARTGIQWVKLGVQTFFRQPFALMGLFFLYTASVLLLGAIPVIGFFIAVVLMPAATLGMMVATEQASKGRFPMPSVLLSAFRAGRQRVRSMLVLGIVYVVILLLISLVVALLGAGGPPLEVTNPESSTPEVQVKPAFFIAVALQMPLLILFAHAPALVHWHGVTPVKSLFFSAIAFWRNLTAFIVFGAAWMLLLSLAGLALALVFALFGSAPTTQSVIPLALMIMVMMSTSMYFTFRDSFLETDDNDAPAPPGGDAT